MMNFPQTELKLERWQTIVLVTLGFWLSGSLMLDCVVMPSCYVSGMMEQPGFASAGYLMFSLFNRVEMFCAALALVGTLVFYRSMREARNLDFVAVVLSCALLAIALIDTYGLTPQMGALGIQLDLFSAPEIPAAMNQMHAAYFTLEALKFLAVGAMLVWCYRFLPVAPARSQ